MLTYDEWHNAIRVCRAPEAGPEDRIMSKVLELNILDYPKGASTSPEIWRRYILQELQAAGFDISKPFHRFDDPKDFGRCIYKQDYVSDADL